MEPTEAETQAILRELNGYTLKIDPAPQLHEIERADIRIIIQTIPHNLSGSGDAQLRLTINRAWSESD